MSLRDVPAWADDLYDSPEAFADAAGYLASRYAVSQKWAARALSELARDGLIVSARLHGEMAQGYADQLAHVSAAADELVRRLHDHGNGDEQ